MIDSKFSKAKIIRKCVAESKENLCHDHGDESVGFMRAIGHILER